MKQKQSYKQSQKIYSPNFLSLVQPTDKDHYKFWNQRQQIHRNILQRKQIDKILHSLVKQRLFGDVLKKNTISNSGDNLSIGSRISNYTDLQKSNLKSSRKTKTIQQKYSLPKRKSIGSILQKLQQISQQKSKKSFSNNSIKYNEQKIVLQQLKLPQIPINNKNKRFQIPKQNNRKFSINLSQSGSSTHRLINNLNRHRKQTEQRQQTVKFHRQLTQNQNNIKTLKTIQFNTDKLNEAFRNIAQNFTTPIIYDIKLTKQKLISYMSKFVDQKICERFCNYFKVPNIINFKQYSTIISNIDNTEFKYINFLLFSLMVEQSKNMFLTVSDLFFLMKNFPNNKKIQKQILLLKQKINQVNRQSNQKIIGSCYVKPTVEQFLLNNNKISIKQVKQLVKVQNNDGLKQSYVPKTTHYLRTVLALEHTVKDRQKQSKIQNSMVNNKRSYSSYLGSIDKQVPQQYKKTIETNNLNGQNLSTAQNKLKSQESTMVSQKGLVFKSGLRFSEYCQVYSDQLSHFWKLLFFAFLGHQYV